MHALLRSIAQKYSHRTALIDSNPSHVTTYQALWEQSGRIAQSLREEFAIRKGDVVCVHGEKSSRYAISQLAVWRAGGIVCPLHPPHPWHGINWDCGRNLPIA